MLSLNERAQPTTFCAQVCKDTPAKIAAFRKEMEPLRQTLKEYKWLGGEQIDYADIAVAGMFLVSPPGPFNNCMSHGTQT